MMIAIIKSPLIFNILEESENDEIVFYKLFNRKEKFITQIAKMEHTKLYVQSAKIMKFKTNLAKLEEILLSINYQILNCYQSVNRLHIKYIIENKNNNEYELIYIKNTKPFYFDVSIITIIIKETIDIYFYKFNLLTIIQNTII